MHPSGVRGVVGVLLAAGAGSRFGGGKLLHALPGGEPLGLRAWRNLTDALPEAIVVVRGGDRQVEQMFRGAGADVVVCEDAHLGMGHSLACAIRARPAARGWVIALADMPGVSPSTIQIIAEQVVADAGIALPFCRGERGHPVGFPARFGEALARLTGDQGARLILRDNPEALVRIEVDDAGVLEDIDTQEDARRLAGREARAQR